MLELLVVLVIMSITAGLFFGMNFQQKESLVLRTFASDLTRFFMTSRSNSLVTGLENRCFYNPETSEIREELKGIQIKVPETVEISLNDFQHQERIILAVFFENGSVALEDFILISGETYFYPQKNLLSGRIRFVESDY